MSNFVIKGQTGDWELVCGLEIHCQVKSASKIFSPASTEFGKDSNHNVDFLDAGMPGMLPQFNEKVLEQGVRTALGLNGKVNLVSEFSRKNYFYADLPLGYQISQADKPIMGEGSVTVKLPSGDEKVIRLERMHLEMDAGKSMHDQYPNYTLIDLNRAGVALMEIVSMPDIRSPEEAGIFLKKLRSIVRYLKTCDGNMDEGSMRCDANISVKPVGSNELRTRCEIKNINSVRFVMQAMEYEANRQVELYENGKGHEIIQETRLYDTELGITRSMRSKENANDYRYFPEPDLLPVIIDEEYVVKIKASIPQLPDEKYKHFVSEYKLSDYDAELLVQEKEISEYFENVVAVCNKPKLAANWIITNIFTLLKERSLSVDSFPVKAENLGKLINLIEEDVISGKIAKDVFTIMSTDDKDPNIIVKEKGLQQITDSSAIEPIVDEVIASSPENVKAYKDGKTKVIGWFVGQIMKKTQGKANPAVVNSLLKEKLR